jgi:hypothetical protein
MTECTHLDQVKNVKPHTHGVLREGTRRAALSLSRGSLDHNRHKAREKIGQVSFVMNWRGFDRAWKCFP